VDVRVTGIVVEGGDRLLLLNQNTEAERSWSLPGGKIDPGETAEQALIRELREETGAEVEVGRLLYVCDVVGAGVLHLTFECRRTGGQLGAIAPGADSRPIRAVEFVEFERLTELGFGEKFVALCRSGFPDAGSYMGGKANIGL
jgi:ADP-ribose pyrophosphatase YjhB (NUDIX family)